MPWASDRRTRRVRTVVVLLLGMVTGAVTAPLADASTLRDQQWGLTTIRAPEVWPTTRGAGTIVAVVDTGVDLTHPDLAPQLLRDRDGRVVGRDFVDGGAPQDEHGHGTLVAGIVAAAGRDAGAVAGVAPRTRIMPLRALDRNGAGSSADIDAAIRWAVDRGADVVNLSLESAVPVPGQVVATGFDQAVRYAWERGVVVVAAAGNSGTPFTDYAPSTPVLLVGATDRDDRRAAFSDGGRSDLVVAPGVEVLTTACDPCGQDPRHGHATASGTSFAAPHVAGAVALLLAEGRSHEQAVEALRRTAVPVRGGGLGSSGHGRIDVAAAMGIDPPAAGEAPRTASPARPQGAVGDGPPQPSPRPSTPPPSTPPPSDTAPDPSPTPQPATPREAPPPADRPEDTAGRTAAEPAPLEPAEPQEADPLTDDEVTAATGTRVRVGLLEMVATAVVGITAVTVAAVIRRVGGLDEIAG